VCSRNLALKSIAVIGVLPFSIVLSIVLLILVRQYITLLDERSIIGGGALLPDGSQGVWTQIHQTCQAHRAIIVTHRLFFRVQISCCIFNASGSELSGVENDAKFCTF